MCMSVIWAMIIVLLRVIEPEKDRVYSAVTSRWPILALVTLAHALGALTALAVAPLAPFLLESLELSRVQVGLFLPAVYLGGVLMALPAGWFTDRLGVRLTFGLGQLLVGAMITLAAWSPSYGLLLFLLVLGGFLRRRPILVAFGCGLALSIAQSSLLAYLVLYAKDSFDVSAVRAAQFLAIAQVGGTVSRVLWGVVSDRSFGGRRRPGVVASAAIGAVSYATLALGSMLPEWLVYPLAFVAGAGAFGWVGLYFALVAEIGGPRHAGLLTGVATACSWSGTLIGPPIFGLVLEATGDYTVPWLILAMVALAVVITLPRLSPLVQRG